MTEAARRRVAVVMGGVCGEREVSLVTGACVVRHLLPRFAVKPVAIHADGTWEAPAGFIGEGIDEDSTSWFRGEGLHALGALSRLKDELVDVVFNGLHGPGGEDGTIQGLLRWAGFPFTGPDVSSAAVTMDKRLTKLVLEADGIATPPGVDFPALASIGTGESAFEWDTLATCAGETTPLPWIVKPNCLGSSVGIEVFDSIEAFTARAEVVGDTLWRVRPAVPGSGFICEQRLEGRELTCGVLETEDGKPSRALPPIEIRPTTSDFFDYHAKYTPGATEEICPAPLNEEETAAVQSVALRVHVLFECAPLSRTDMFLHDDGSLTVLEVNTLPGMTDTSLIPQSAQADGIELEELFAGLVAHALRREETRDSVGSL